jgi:hypothetical protein
MRVVRVTSDEIFRASDLGPSPDTLEPSQEAPETDEQTPDYPLVMVTWHDAWFDFDQTEADDCRTDYLVKTVGFLLSEGPNFLSIAQEMLPDGDGFRAVTHIPVPIIESVTELGDVPEAQEQRG